MQADFEVLHLRSSAGLYGAEYVILGMIPELAKLGISSRLLSIDNQHTSEQALYARAHALGLNAERVPCRGRFDLATVKSLRDILRRSPRSVLHVHDYKSAFLAWIARGRRDVPIVSTSHGHFPTTANLRLYNRLEMTLMRRFDRVCVVSQDMPEVLARAGVSPAKIQLIENGIDTLRFAPDATPLSRAQFGIADDALVFGSAMRLTEQKNPLGLIRAFARVAAQIPQAVLVLAGDGPLRAAINACAAELSVSDRVHLIGVRDDLESFYRMLDVFVLPSHYEGLPLALLEAMACERPIVASDVGQIRTVLQGLSATLVPANDEKPLARAMCEAPRQANTQALRARVIERYSVARMAQSYAMVYRDVWQGHGRAAA